MALLSLFVIYTVLRVVMVPVFGLRSCICVRVPLNRQGFGIMMWTLKAIFLRAENGGPFTLPSFPAAHPSTKLHTSTKFQHIGLKCALKRA